jgi:hypothetical protein
MHMDGAAASDATAEVWTCPMHPEVRMSAPGNCPKCGMTLVKVANQAAGEAMPAMNDDMHGMDMRGSTAAPPTDGAPPANHAP